MLVVLVSNRMTGSALFLLLQFKRAFRFGQFWLALLKGASPHLSIFASNGVASLKHCSSWAVKLSRS